MVGSIRRNRMLATFVLLALMIGTLGSLNVDAQRRWGRNRRPNHSKAKGALVGAGVGLLGGALIGGRKGAVIGAGVGAGSGYLIQRHRNNRRHRRHFRRF
jgi:outer membrane lipoprotein SlyB